MRVADVMTKDVVTADITDSVREASGQMLDHGTGSVVVLKDGDPAGILTKIDVMRAGHEHDRPLSEIPVYAAASRPLVTVEESTTVRAASIRMFDHGVHHLPVADGIELAGIVTATDLLEAQEGLLKEVHELEEQREEWES
jgi:CBS-domain-containing membrane protein